MELFPLPEFFFLSLSLSFPWLPQLFVAVVVFAAFYPWWRSVAVPQLRIPRNPNMHYNSEFAKAGESGLFQSPLLCNPLAVQSRMAGRLCSFSDELDPPSIGAYQLAHPAMVQYPVTWARINPRPRQQRRGYNSLPQRCNGDEGVGVLSPSSVSLLFCSATMNQA